MLPKILTSRLEVILKEDYRSVLEAFDSKRIGSFRINTLKSDEEEVFTEFREKGIMVEPYPLIPGVFTFTKDQAYAIKGSDAFYKGKIYLQSISSMLPAIVLGAEKGDAILDVCAAPGSKTTQMAMMMRNEGKIVALEQNQIRYDKLMYNARLQGATIIEGKKVDAVRYLCDSKLEIRNSKGVIEASHESRISSYDKILLDAPCSAEGRIELQNEKSYGFWSIENIRKKAEIQYELLSLSLKQLKTGGTLVYSTCTLAPEENEGVIARVLCENSHLVLMPIEIGLSEKNWWRQGLANFEDNQYGEVMKNTVRILPSSETEGFFIAKIQKN